MCLILNDIQIKINKIYLLIESAKASLIPFYINLKIWVTLSRLRWENTTLIFFHMILELVQVVLKQELEQMIPSDLMWCQWIMAAPLKRSQPRREIKSSKIDLCILRLQEHRTKILTSLGTKRKPTLLFKALQALETEMWEQDTMQLLDQECSLKEQALMILRDPHLVLDKKINGRVEYLKVPFKSRLGERSSDSQTQESRSCLEVTRSILITDLMLCLF